MSAYVSSLWKLEPPKKGYYTWYQCGPTTYADAHIGHARVYLMFDVLRRIMEHYTGFPIITAMNVTDIDDKIISKAAEANTSFANISKFYSERFFEDMKALNVREPDITLPVTEHADSIIEFIVLLVRQGYAYERDRSVYFDMAKYKKSGFTYEKFRRCGGSDEANTDFVLWKAQKHDGEPSWVSPWGKGRFGWHTECVALANKAFPEGIDIHAGGIDLAFPHHSNEIAQAEAAANVHNWVKAFLHSGHLHVCGSKMSKSLKNCTTIRSFLQKYTPDQTRMLFLMHKWNDSLDFSDVMMDSVVNVEKTIAESLKLSCPTRVHTVTASARLLLEQLQETRTAIDAAMQDNFDTPAVIKHLQTIVCQFNTYITDQGFDTVAYQVQLYMRKIWTLLGMQNSSTAEEAYSNHADKLIQIVVEHRERLRKLAGVDKNKSLFRLSDDLRTSLGKAGIHLQDGATTMLRR